MEALYLQPPEESEAMAEEEEEEEKCGEQDEGGMEASSSAGCSTEEEADEDSEPEPPPVVRRKVSFADAFGLDLVSVKEFDNVEATEPDPVNWSGDRPAARALEEFYLSCLFTAPSSPEELEQRLQAQMVELESIELLPGTSTLRGHVRVANLCYSKSVYARMSLDRWGSFFDLLAEYVPGSSDRKTDRFTFRYTLVPPFDKEGVRIEFCLRYETSVGTFWANNKDMNYVLFCHQRGLVKEHGAQTHEETSSYRSKKSSLRANRNGSAEEKTKETIYTNALAAESDTPLKAKKAGSEKMGSSCEENKLWVESIKRRRKATRLAHVQDHFFKKRQQLPKAPPDNSAYGGKPHATSALGEATGIDHKSQKVQSSESPPVLTYHQIPLLPLDWNSDAQQQWGAADDILTGGAKVTLSKASKENRPAVNDTWESIPKASSSEKPSVSDVWQVFPNGPGHRDHSDVPESEWLQAAALVSLSNDKEPRIQNAARSQEFAELAGGTLSVAGALNAEDRRPVEACVGSPGDDIAEARDASQRSQTNSVTDTPREFSLERAPPVSEDAVDSPKECHKHEDGERESKGIMERAQGRAGDEPRTLHTADLVTSSGELETTDMTAMPESQNASAIDRISQGAREDEALSSSEDGEVTGTAHNAGDDILAFRETISQETKDGARCDFSTSRQGVEEGITMSHAEKKGEGTFRAGKTKESENSTRCTNEVVRENLEGNLQQNQTVATEANENVPSNHQQMEIFKKTACKETERQIGTDMRMIKTLDEQLNTKGSQLLRSGQMGSPSFTLGECVQKRGDSAPTQIDQSAELKSETGEQASNVNQIAERKCFSCDGEAMEGGEINPSAHKRPTAELEEAFEKNRETLGACPADECNPKLLELVEFKPTHLKGQKEDVSSEISLEKVVSEQNGTKRGFSTGSQHEMSEKIEEGSQEDERVSVGKLKMEASGESMDNVENPKGQRESAMKDELSVEVESSPWGEDKKQSDGTKDPITAENSASLEVIEPGLEQMFFERFGEDLLRRIWEEVFVPEVQPLRSDANSIDEMRSRLTGSTPGCHLVSQKDLSDTFDSGVFSLTEPETDLKSRLYRGLEQTSLAESSERSPKDGSQSLTTKEPTPVFRELQIDLDSRAYLGQNTPLTETAQDQENHHSPIKERPVNPQEAACQTGEHEKESPDQSAHQFGKHLSSSEKAKEPDALLWWTALFALSHITKRLIYTFLVSGFFVIVFLYDFPALFPLYMFSLCWWILKWKRHQAMAEKAAEG
ncbi:uncharacterized protein ppp1r3aa [Menidia menidia]